MQICACMRTAASVWQKNVNSGYRYSGLHKLKKTILFKFVVLIVFLTKM